MKAEVTNTRDKLKQAGLKVTPQRLAILEAIYMLNNHPTAENILEYIHEVHPGIAAGTVYKILDVLVENKLISRVKTEKDVMRYDGVMESHHHLYSSMSGRIEDYNNEALNRMLEKFFKENRIPGFEIEDIKLQIIGRFSNKNKQ